MGVHEVGGAPAHTLTHVRLQLKKFGGLVLYTQVRACVHSRSMRVSRQLVRDRMESQQA